MTDASLSETAVLINDAIAKYELDKAIALINNNSDVTGVNLRIVISNLERTYNYLEQNYVLEDPEKLARCNNHKDELTKILMLLLEKKVKLDGLLFKIKDLSIAKLLIEHGADVNEVDEYGNSLIHHDFTCKMFKLLIDNGADVNKVDPRGNRLINVVHDFETIKLLTEKGADISGCLENNIKRLFDCINEHGRYVDYGNKRLNDDLLGDRVLRVDTSKQVHNYFEICKFLLNNGANPDITVEGMKLIDLQNNWEFAHKWYNFF